MKSAADFKAGGAKLLRKVINRRNSVLCSGLPCRMTVIRTEVQM